MRTRLLLTRILIAAFLCSALLANGASARADDETSKLDHAGLKTMLENMGYEFTDGKFDSGLVYYLIEEPHQGATYKITVYLSKNGEYLWVESGFGSVPSDKQIPCEILLKMLHANFDSVYMDFVMSARSGNLQMDCSLYNQAITPLMLRKVIAEAVSLTHKHRDLWTSKNWVNKEAPESSDKPEKDADPKAEPESDEPSEESDPAG